MSVREDLSIENEVHPQHGEEEPAACGQYGGGSAHRLIVSQFAIAVVPVEQVLICKPAAVA
jgi:hypothetical protein